MPQRKRATGKLKPSRARHPRHDEIETRIDAIVHSLSAGVPGITANVMTGLLGEDDDIQELALEILEKRLSSSRDDVPVIVLDVLNVFPVGDPIKAWERIAGSRGASDVMRMGARLRAGWPDYGQGRKRISFLKSLRGGDQALVDLISQGCLSWPDQVELLDEALSYLEALPSERRQWVATRVAADTGPPSLLMLHALLHMDDPPLQRVVLAEIDRLGQPVSLKPVGRLAGTADDDSIRATASALLESLRGRAPAGVLGIHQLPGVSSSTVTRLDAHGGQAVMLFRAWGSNIQVLSHYWLNAETGVTSSYGATRLNDDDVDLTLDEFELAGSVLIDVPVETVRGGLVAAEEASIRRGQPFPTRYELWEPFAHETWPPDGDEPVTVPMLDDSAFTGDRKRVRASGALFDTPWFQTWTFDSTATSIAMVLVDPPKRGRWTNRQYDPLISGVATSPVLAGLRRRLRMQAWLLDHEGESELRDTALAVSASLVSATSIELVEHPFLRRMIEETVNSMLNPLAMLGSLGPDDLDLLDDDFDDEDEFDDIVDIDTRR